MAVDVRPSGSGSRRGASWFGVAALTATLLLAALPVPAAPGESVRPVPGEVVASFAPPPTPYGPGRRGVRLAAEPGEAVRAVRSGRVAFAGPVAGTPWVTVDHGGGLATSYGPVAPLVAVGQQVAAGALLGRLVEDAEVGSAQAGLHWGARVQSAYIDPLELLGAWRPTLLPHEGRRPPLRASAGPGLPRRSPARPQSAILTGRPAVKVQRPNPQRRLGARGARFEPGDGPLSAPPVRGGRPGGARPNRDREVHP